MRIARRKLGAAVLPRLAPGFLGALARSWRLEVLGKEHRDLAFAGAGLVATLWHGRMLVPLPAHRDQELCVLVSPSDDGALVTTLLERFGYRTVRGSSSKNPARAIRELLAELRGGARVVITPDGPRGPRHSVNPGPAWMARETGFPILPFGCACDRAWYLRSWDRFTIPKPRARVALVYGKLLRVGPDAGEDELARVTHEMRARMLACEQLGFRHLGREPDW